MKSWAYRLIKGERSELTFYDDFHSQKDLQLDSWQTLVTAATWCHEACCFCLHTSQVVLLFPLFLLLLDALLKLPTYLYMYAEVKENITLLVIHNFLILLVWSTEYKNFYFHYGNAIALYSTITGDNQSKFMLKKYFTIILRKNCNLITSPSSELQSKSTGHWSESHHM